MVRIRASGLQARKGGLELVAADRIVDHVDAAQILADRANVLGPGIDEVIGAGLAGHVELVLPAGAGDDPRAHQLADLDRGQPHAARRAQHQKRFAGLQPCLVVERHVACAIGDLEGGGVGEAHAVGQDDRALGGKAAMLGQPAVTGKHGDPTADRRPVRVGADRLDAARHLHPEGEGRLGCFLILALDHQQIGEIQPAGGDGDADFSRSGCRSCNVVNGRAVPTDVMLYARMIPIRLIELYARPRSMHGFNAIRAGKVACGFPTRVQVLCWSRLSGGFAFELSGLRKRHVND